MSWGWRNAGYESYAVDLNKEVAHFRKVHNNPISNEDKEFSRETNRRTTISTYKIPNKKVNIAERVNKFTHIYHSDEHSRYLSYDHIRREYIRLKNDSDNKDLLALNLYAYLASWGMLRNSFLMQKDYKFLIPIVDILCEDKYKSLINYNPFVDNDDTSAYLIMDLVKRMRRYFLGQKYFGEGSDKKKVVTSVSDTLVTKILLGTLGCTVAYDTYVRKGLANHGLIQKLSAASILQLREFAKINQEEIEDILSNLNELYTPMKIIDMYFFEEGFSI